MVALSLRLELSEKFLRPEIIFGNRRRLDLFHRYGNTARLLELRAVGFQISDTETLLQVLSL
jgi:hypothetical protein